MNSETSAHGTRAATLFALASATLMIAHQVAGKATRDAVFLSHFDVTELPKVVITAAILSMVAVVLMSRLLVVYGPWRVIPSAFGVSAVLFIANWWFFDVAAEKVAIALYLQMAIFGAVLISGFWSVVNERFDPHTAKHTIARVAAAATLGGVLGGFIVGRVASALDVRSMLIVLGVLHLACAYSVRSIGESRRGQRTERQPELQSGIELLVTNRYLQLMALLMVLAAVLAALVDYAFKAAAVDRFTSGEELVTFFGQFYAAVGVLTFLVQSALGPRVLKNYGIGITLAAMPAVALGAGLVSIATFTKFWSVVAVRAGQVAFANSFFRSAFELLYTPLPAPTKRPTKTIIDVASDRLGDVIGSGILLALLAISPALPTSAVIVIAIVAAGLTLLVVRALYRGYVDQLATRLRRGAIALTEDQVVDATTRRTLAEMTSASEREVLMEKIREMRASREVSNTGYADDNIYSVQFANDTVDPDGVRELSVAITDLLSGDPARIERSLSSPQLDARLVPFLVPLLANDEIAEDIRMELRWKAPQAIGALTDALLDPDLPLLARQRIPSVLEVTHNPRAVSALVLGLMDDEFNVRYSCARALARMNERDASLKIGTSVVYAAVEREVSVDRAEWESRQLETEISMPTGMVSGALSADPRIDYSMEHVFTLLSLILDHDALMLSRHAVSSSDRNLRGTALEYLENVLPENVRQGLWPHFGEPAPQPRRKTENSVPPSPARDAGTKPS
tara:strand:+ start:370 stop:2592 length:2223 start_codon:yes stop_codon:yes gene_type:complete